jgi:hypothetical protein
MIFRVRVVAKLSVEMNIEDELKILIQDIDE